MPPPPWQLWAIIHRNLDQALEATRVVDEDSGDTLNRNAKAVALSIFEGTKQRFFAQLLLSMKLPSLIHAMEASLGEDNSVVVLEAVYGHKTHQQLPSHVR